MFAASKSGSAADAKDPQFNYVTMLLHGDGTNGAQNNTFLDSSTNAFSITRNGNTTQGTFTPYGSNWSSYVNGSSYFNVGSTRFLDASAWTVEMWINTTTSANFVSLACQYINTGGGFSARTVLGINSSTGTVAIFQGGTTQSGTTNICNGQWNHVAFVLSSGTVKAYVNGVNEATFTGFGTPTAITTLFYYDGYNSTSYYLGYASNLRVTNTAVYTTTFTPSTTPLTAITGTQLLTLQSNRFIDNSTNAYAVTVNGTPSVQRFSPFSPTTAYSTSVIGGSGYFDGSGDYLSAGSSISLTGDFTVEGWVYRTTTSGNGNYLFGLGNDVFSTGATFYVDPTTGCLRIYTANAHILSNTTNSAQLNTWNHIAFVRSGTTVKAYLNGVQVDSATFVSVLSGTAYINAELNGNPTAIVYVGSAGYLSNVRVGTTAVYTTAFTPSTAPLTAITGTQLLLSYTNAGILDNAMMNDLETVGNAQISTSVKKYGTGSIAFDGSGDWLVTPYNPNWILSGDFTIECWLYWTAHGSYGGIVGCANSNTGSAISAGWYLDFNSTSNNLQFEGQGGVSVVTTNVIPSSQWVHIAVVRSGSTITHYLNGVANGSGTSSTSFNSATYPLYVGVDRGNTSTLTGYIDDLRISKVARYTANFTAPTTAFADKG